VIKKGVRVLRKNANAIWSEEARGRKRCPSLLLSLVKHFSGGFKAGKRRIGTNILPLSL
jgi:hypothetical protein